MYPLLVFLLVLGAGLVRAAAATDGQVLPIRGADLSLLGFLEARGVQFKDQGHPEDAIAICRQHGLNYIRLRLFLQPDGTAGQVNSLPYTLALAQRVKAAGLHLLLDLHYSDGWADPGHQVTPRAWQGLDHSQLVEKVFAYTRDTLLDFQRAGCRPDMVEVGNEITHGMLWPDGRNASEAGWDRFADLLKAGIRGVRAADPDGSIKILIHVDRGSHLSVSRWFFDHLTARHVPFDDIGLSYYPFWNGPLPGLEKNLAFLATTYHKDIIIAETDCNWRGGDPKRAYFPATPAGQEAFLAQLIRTVAATPGGHGQGVFYWGGEWIDNGPWPGAGWLNAWGDRALFDHSGNALPVMNAFQTVPRT